jgi:hypothetical protein
MTVTGWVDYMKEAPRASDSLSSPPQSTRMREIHPLRLCLAI